MMSTVGGGFVPPPTSHSNRELRERDRQRRREDGHRKQRAETIRQRIEARERRKGGQR
jgi:hypothetical protein